MEKYLKMSDVFEGEVKPKHIDEECIAEIVHGEDSGKCWTIEDSKYWMAMQYEHAGYAAHAINSHDELVEMNKELLAVIDRVIGSSEKFDKVMGTSEWADGYKQCAIDTGEALRGILDAMKARAAS